MRRADCFAGCGAGRHRLDRLGLMLGPVLVLEIAACSQVRPGSTWIISLMVQPGPVIDDKFTLETEG